MFESDTLKEDGVVEGQSKASFVPISGDTKLEVRKAYHSGFGQLIVDGGDNLFYAHFLADFSLTISNNPTFIAGVTVKNKRVGLVLGAGLLDYKHHERVAILKHEVLHILFRHWMRKGERNHELFNVACDIAINQFIKNLPENACGLMTGVKAGEEPLLALQSAEYYYNELIKRGVKIVHVFDDHEGWANNMTQDELTELDMSIKGMAERAKTRSRGSLSSDMEELLTLSGIGGRVSWQTALRRGTSKRSKQRVETIKKRNKRYPTRVEMRGFKRKYSSDLLIILDVSGSVANEDVIRGMLAVKNVCQQTGAVASILQIDTEVKGISVLNANDTKFIRRASGGTTLYPAVEYITKNNMNPDMILVMTDGCIESSWETPPRKNVMFLLFNPSDTLALDTSNFPSKPLVYHL